MRIWESVFSDQCGAVAARPRVKRLWDTPVGLCRHVDKEDHVSPDIVLYTAHLCMRQ